MEDWLANWNRLSDEAWYRSEDGPFRHRFAVPASRLPATMEAWGLTAAEFAAVPVVAEVVGVLQAAVERVRVAREIMAREGLVVNDLTDQWQELAFTLYTMLVAATEQARRALDALGVADAADVHFEPASGRVEHFGLVRDGGADDGD